MQDFFKKHILSLLMTFLNAMLTKDVVDKLIELVKVYADLNLSGEDKHKLVLNAIKSAENSYLTSLQSLSTGWQSFIVSGVVEWLRFSGAISKESTVYTQPATDLQDSLGIAAKGTMQSGIGVVEGGAKPKDTDDGHVDEPIIN